MPLEERLYGLADDELEFFKRETGIKDPEALKEHILRIQAEAYAVYPYPCIRRFSFTGLKVSRYPAYRDLLKLGRERPGALFLDVGCCFGNDVRKAVADGFPMNQALASDLRPEFWDLGYKLFNSTSDSFPVPFIPGDIFDQSILTVASPANASPPLPAPPLSDVTSLTPLNGHLSAIHASAFFHLFDEPQQLYVAKALAGLLSPQPGSIIFGSHRGALAKGARVEDDKWASGGPMFNHSAESWNEMWEKEVFGEGQVKSWAILKDTKRPDLVHITGTKFYLLVWCVTRL
ncbi:hypothetical protein BXZ70DRAFT_1002232 [Cristinia sonorae]|uniref:Methyltransferase ausD n=1 Tax=Cristinia sonorae TaxID=1940300 RepID=A0A8K0UH38_9AGAR|nr:hypothetical protein BXZ70DRAFT_1002232 [Cristinia sonorae]